ncbi:MAG: NAD(P)/FAD-dependent oxidoreductase [Spirochaetes bacterium]|nr:NAD(P)/FAD-dependent oxidoreductase [Spirochaetota bacterium]
MHKSSYSADFIIIGSGLAGLCAAAFLSQANYKVIVLEKNSEIGGKCGVRTIDNHRYVIGANTFGSRIVHTLKNLGIKLEWIPVPFKLYGKGGNLNFPLDISSIKEINKFGINFFSFINLVSRISFSMLKPSTSKISYFDFINKIVKAPEIKEFLYLEAMFVGAHPCWLPATALKHFLGTYYGYHKPIYPLQGAQAIPNALANYIKAKGGEVLTKKNVTEICIENKKPHGVKVDNQWFTAKYSIISNAELSQTQSMLNRNGSDTIKLNNILSGSTSAFPLALLILTLKSSNAPDIIAKPAYSSETSITILTRPICEVIDELNSGQINELPICNLILSDLKAQLLNGDHLDTLPVHIPIPWPKSLKFNAESNKLIQAGITEIDKKYPGFADAVISSKLILPDEYEQLFGFSSSIAPVLDTLTYKKHSWKLPIKGLFNVGTTVLPVGSHAGCAMESGFCCASDILQSL